MRRTVRVHRYALIGVVLSCSGTARAYRPFDGTDADVADFGEFELELGPAETVREEGRNFLLAPAVVLNLGILPRTELVADFVGTAPLHPQSGERSYSVNDTDVVMKFLLRRGQLQDETGASIALEAGVLTPGIHSEEQGVGAKANVIFSARHDWFMVHLNNDAELSRKEYEFSWSNTLITEFHFDDVAWPVMELGRGISASESVYSALIGAIWSADDGLDIDAGWLVASVDGEAAFEARLGLTWTACLWAHDEGTGR